jgi:hypothetical protein
MRNRPARQNLRPEIEPVQARRRPCSSAVSSPAGTGSIFMLHRFADRSGKRRADPVVVRADLAYSGARDTSCVLARAGSPVARPHSRLGRTVAFTVDDGYADFASVGAGILPSSTARSPFSWLPGGGGRRLVLVGSSARDDGPRPAEQAELDVGGGHFPLAWNARPRSQDGKGAGQTLKRVSDAERRRVLDDVETLLGVEAARAPAGSRR